MQSGFIVVYDCLLPVITRKILYHGSTKTLFLFSLCKKKSYQYFHDIAAYSGILGSCPTLLWLRALLHV